ncbi:hypothetical protein ACFSQU_05680 [Massilia sp. GCM10020059]|uniref:Integron gene cassette protein n=1 Tax=Massilia agrisoli TaxID=2892444 RepID=A0ABS8IX56_9BURK|nr:hypothetical protein [Massilia agrisoli]MCC6073207.1 hypothetical protein [Massilia agrisoli]
MKTMSGGHGFNVQQSVTKKIGIVVLVTAAILLVPLIAMQFTGEVNWSAFDFVVAGVLLAGTGLAYILSTMKMSSPRSRLAIGAMLAVALVLVWAELAVGLFGTPFAGS